MASSRRGNGEDDAPAPLEWRFRAIEQHLKSLDHTVNALGPAVGQVAGLDSDVDNAREDIKELKTLFRDLEKGMNDVIRSSRSDTLKYVAFTVGPAIIAAGAIIVALLTGNVPGKP